MFLRLCFKGFCLGPQRPSAVEKSSQTILTQSTAIDTFNITTFFDKTSSIDAFLALSKPIEDLRQQPNKESYTMINPEEINFQQHNINLEEINFQQHNINAAEVNFQQHNSESLNSGNISAILSDNSSVNVLPFITEDSQNNNHLVSTSSQMELTKCDVDSLNNTVENIYINDGADVSMQELDPEQHLTDKEKDLIRVIQIKDVRIKQLEDQITRRDEEIANLKSHLDKFQSVFPFRSSGPGAIHPGRKIGRNIQRQRAQGISAEPQSESSMHDLLSVTFPKYEKEEQ